MQASTTRVNFQMNTKNKMVDIMMEKRKIGNVKKAGN